MTIFPGCKCCGPCWRCYFFYGYPNDPPAKPLEECPCWDGTTPVYRVWPTSISWKLFYDSYQFAGGVPPEDVEDGLARTIALLETLKAGKSYPLLRPDPARPYGLLLYGEEKTVEGEDVFGPFTAQINNHWFFSWDCVPDGFDSTPDPSMSWGVHHQSYKIGEDPLSGLNTLSNLLEFATEPLPDGAENADQNGVVTLDFHPYASNTQAYTSIDPCSPNESNDFVLYNAGFLVTKTFENGNTSRALFNLVNPRIEYTIGFSFQSTPEVGHYCWPTGDCFSGTKEEAFLNRGHWFPGNCSQFPCEAIEPDSFECRTERVSLNEYPVGKCHPTEEECAESCGPCWRCYTNGLAYECVGPDDTPQDGWGPVGKCHPTEQDCAEECFGGCALPEATCLDLVVTDVKSLVMVDNNGNPGSSTGYPDKSSEIRSWLESLKVRFYASKNPNFDPNNDARYYSLASSGSVYCDVCETVPPCMPGVSDPYTQIYQNYLSVPYSVATDSGYGCTNYIRYDQYGGKIECRGGNELDPRPPYAVYRNGLTLSVSPACASVIGSVGALYFWTETTSVELPKDWTKKGFKFSQTFPLGTSPPPIFGGYSRVGPIVYDIKGDGNVANYYPVSLDYEFRVVEDCETCADRTFTTGCCTGGELIRCVDINTGLEIVCPSCGDPDWGYEVGEIYWTCWEEPDAEWCKEQEAADPSTYRFLDDYCNTAFYSDVQGSTFPVEDCPETAEFYGPDPFSSCVTIRREVETPSGKIMFDIKPLPEEALERLKRDNPLP